MYIFLLDHLCLFWQCSIPLIPKLVVFLTNSPVKFWGTPFHFRSIDSTANQFWKHWNIINRTGKQNVLLSNWILCRHKYEIKWENCLFRKTAQCVNSLNLNCFFFFTGLKLRFMDLSCIDVAILVKSIYYSSWALRLLNWCKRDANYTSWL